jgi:hypothetical protein
VDKAGKPDANPFSRYRETIVFKSIIIRFLLYLHDINLGLVDIGNYTY